jgi:hypothetical protein
MQLIYNGMYCYGGPQSHSSYCWLRVYTAPDQAVVIATEVADNPGISITNAVESLATQVAQRFAIPFDTLTWIEHYPERIVNGGRLTIPESFDQVTFMQGPTGFDRPEWRHLQQSQVEALIGEAIAPLPQRSKRTATQREAQ